MSHTFPRLTVLTILLLASAEVASAQSRETPNDTARKFVAMYEKDVRPLEITLNLAWWKANTSGKDEDFAAKEQAQNRYDAALSNREHFATLKSLHETPPADPLLARQVELLYRWYLEKQVDEQLLKRIAGKSNETEQAFNVYRAKVGDRTLTDSEVRKVLKESKSSAERQAVWEASKGVGKVVEADLKQLVFWRNEAARSVGFKNFQALRLYMAEQDAEQVLKLFDELDALTREPFAAAKREIDLKLAIDCGIGVDELRPWHYHDPFFQEPPDVYETKLDPVFAGADILAISRKFYSGIGLPIEDVIERSDLYEKPGKSPHAFCTDIDRAGDVRVLANIVPNEQWMSTMLHELGHSVYSSKNIPMTIPYVLRSDAHILCTEGVAMMFERFSKSGEWLVAMGVSLADPKAYTAAGSKKRRNDLLIFSRWCQVVFRFEKEMYENPGQDLNKLWWDLVEKYQLVKRPEGRNAPDYASKIHIVNTPVYYHNYLMGQLFACQVHEAIARDVLKASDVANAIYTANPAVGQFMKDRVFSQGATRSWNELTKYATGAELNAKAFAAEISAR